MSLVGFFKQKGTYPMFAGSQSLRARVRVRASSLKQVTPPFARRNGALLVSAALTGLLALLPMGQQAQAVTVDVTTVDNLSTTTGTNSPAAGDVWNLQIDGVYLSNNVNVPTGTGLFFNGVPGVRTLTLHDANPSYGRFYGGTGGSLLTLSNVTLDGGNSSAAPLSTNGGAVFADTVKGSDSVVFTNNTGNNGGAVRANVGGAAFTGSLTASRNTATASGGAISAVGPTTVSVSQAVELTNNTAATDGGAIQASQGSAVNLATASGDATLTDNTATAGFGGAVRAATTGSSIIIGNSAGAVYVNKNTAGTSGGGLSSGGTVTIYGKSINLNDNKVTTGGVGGAIAATSDVTIGDTATDTIEIRRNSAYGDAAGNSGGGAISSSADVTLTSAFFNIIGNGVYNPGAGANNSGGAITATTGKVTLTGAGVVGTNSTNGLGGSIGARSVALNAQGGDITFGGTTSSYQHYTGAGTGEANAIYLRDGGTADFNAAADTAIVFYEPIQGTATTVTASGAGRVVFDGQYQTTVANKTSLLSAATTVQSPTTFALRNGAVYGQAANVGSFAVNGGATLAGGTAGGEVRAGAVTLAGTLDIAGTPDIGYAAGYVPFTLSSTTLGLGGTVQARTLMNSGTPQSSDKLVIDGGTASGAATLTVVPTGFGAATTGNGILVVEAINNATTGAAAFTLAGGQTLATRIDTFSGYSYTLQKGTTPATEQNWYLVSTNTGIIPPGPNPYALGSGVAVPTMSPAMLALLALLMAGGTVVALRRKG
jgi:predicted outer membrane repeat protein